VISDKVVCEFQQVSFTCVFLNLHLWAHRWEGLKLMILTLGRMLKWNIALLLVMAAQCLIFTAIRTHKKEQSF